MVCPFCLYEYYLHNYNKRNLQQIACNQQPQPTSKKSKIYSVRKTASIPDTSHFLPIMERAGTAFHSSQNVMNEEVTRMIPGINTVVK